MSDYPALPLWTDRYLSDLHPILTLEQHGCMILLMQAAWRRDKARLLDDDKWFCRFLGIHGNAWRRLKREVLARYWMQESDETGTYWFMKKLRKEWEFVRKTRRKQKENAEKRWAHSSENNNIADANAYAPTPTPTPTPILEQQERTDTANPVSTTSPLPEKTIPTHTLPPGENSPNGHVIELKEAKPAKQYAFTGEMFKITSKDFQKWRRSYWAVPDLMAMLEHIDMYYQFAEKQPKNMFFAVAGWLLNEHQKRKERGAMMPTWLKKEMGKC